jgi:hypothetical protein
MKSEFWTGDYREEDNILPTGKIAVVASSRYRH